MSEDQENIETVLDEEAQKVEERYPQVKKQPANQLSVRDTQTSALMDPNVYIQMKALANDFIKSKAVPKCWETASQVLVGLQTGLEMGMKPMEAMNSLYPVNGSINVWGKATTRRIREHGYTIKYSKESQEEVTCTISKGKEKYTETYTFDEAEQSGYTKDNYGKLKIGWKPGMNRKKKLRYGVLSLIINTYIPEVLGAAQGIVEVAQDYELSDNNKNTIDDKRSKMIEAQNNFKKQGEAKPVESSEDE